MLRTLDELIAHIPADLLIEPWGHIRSQAVEPIFQTNLKALPTRWGNEPVNRHYKPLRLTPILRQPPISYVML
jgi:hypothetical protein